MYPDFPNTVKKKQQVVDLNLARDVKAYAKSWLDMMNQYSTIGHPSTLPPLNRSLNI